MRKKLPWVFIALAVAVTGSALAKNRTPPAPDDGSRPLVLPLPADSRDITHDVGRPLVLPAPADSVNITPAPAPDDGGEHDSDDHRE